MEVKAEPPPHPRDGDDRPNGDADDVLLELRDVKTHFYTEHGILKAVDGVDLTIRRNQTLGIVGESGCGKSILALTILGLLPGSSVRVTGEALYHRKDGTVVDLAKLGGMSKEIREIRGGEIAMIFQEPMTSLNPVYTIGNQIIEAIQIHQRVGLKEARNRTLEMLELVGIPSPKQRIDEYPYQLSGGMRQRVMIAMAMSCNPTLLIADEPTTALDVTIQAQILELMEKLQEEKDTAIIMITHDLGVVAGMADNIAVMYLGQIIEYGSVETVFTRRSHPYTQGLFHSIPVIGSRGRKRLEPIAGVVPDPRFIADGCRFADRCPKRMPRCDQEPVNFEVEPGAFARCWLHAPEAIACD